MVGLWPGGLALGATTADTGVPVELVLVQAARVSRMIAAADQMTGWMVRRAEGRAVRFALTWGASVRWGSERFSGAGSRGPRPGRPSGRRPRGCPAAGCRTGPGR